MGGPRSLEERIASLEKEIAAIKEVLLNFPLFDNESPVKSCRVCEVLIGSWSVYCATCRAG